jgi:hypothetical protein
VARINAAWRCSRGRALRPRTRFTLRPGRI